MLMRPLVATSALAVACVLAGCPKPAANPVAASTAAPTPGLTAPVQAPPTASSRAVVTGTLSVPAGIVASGAGNIVASGAGNWRSLQAVKTSAVAGAKVYLADAAGNPIPNLAAVQTDATGKFTIPDVPPGFTFVVAAEARTKDGKTATFQTLTKSTELGATADITPSTALVTAAVVRDLKNGDLGAFNPSAFRTAAETTEKNLADDKLPDFSSRADVLAKMDVLIAAVGELKQSLDQVKQDLADIKQSIAEIQKAIDQRNATPAPGATPTPTPEVRNPDPTPTPATGTTSRPTPTPTPATSSTGTPQPAGGCTEPREHFFHPSINGANAPTSWRFSVLTPSGTIITETAIDANGTATVKAPEGCPVNLLLTDPAGNKNMVPFNVIVGGRDSATSPIVVNYPPPQGSTASTTCTKQQVRLKVSSKSGVVIKKIQLAISDGSSYSADVSTDGIASLIAPVGCPLDANGFDAGGNRVGPIHLSIMDPNNPPPFELP